jgi:hypothetical protein
MVRSGEIGLVGAMYDVTTGEVVFYNDTLHLQEAKTADMAV